MEQISPKGHTMTLTPEEAAEQIIGRYNIFEIITDLDIDRWYGENGNPGGVYRFTGFLRENGIEPCPKCGAWANGRCLNCEKVERVGR